MMAVLDYSTGVLRISDTMEVISSPSATSTINLGNTTTNNKSSIQYKNNTNLLTLSTNSGIGNIYVDTSGHLGINITMEAIYQGASEATPHIWGSDYTLEYDATSTNVRSGGLWVGKGSYGSAPTPSTSADDLVIENATSAGISILSATEGGIRWGDAANNTAAFFEYNHTSDYMRVGGKGNGSEIARFNSTGHFIVSKTSTASSTAGTVLYSDGADIEELNNKLDNL